MPIAHQVDALKFRLASLRSHDAELRAVVEGERAKCHMLCTAAIERQEQNALQEVLPTQSEADESESQIRISRANVQQCDAVIEQAEAEREAVRAKVAVVESLLNEAVNAPVSGGRDPTAELPDELMLLVLELLPFETLLSGACEHVCQRWARLMESSSIVRRKRGGRWVAYEAGEIKPRMLEGHTDDVNALAIGLDGKVYSGSSDKTIMVWSAVESGAPTHLQTLQGHTDGVCALAVGLDGNIFSGSRDHTVRVWSGANGAHVRTLEGHTGFVFALAVGLDGKIYSGSSDTTVRVWAGNDGAHLHTLVGHALYVKALAVGKDGTVYSSSLDHTIRMWSGDDGALLRTLAMHAGLVRALAVGPDARVYSGAGNDSIQIWSPDDGRLVLTLAGDMRGGGINALVASHDLKVFSGSDDGTLRVWNSKSGARMHAFNVSAERVHALAMGSDGTLYLGRAACIELW